jgi:uncharacterized phiE125 gp8 family phage protein
MIESDMLALPPAAVGEAKAYLRAVGTDEDPLIARLLGSAAELCEQFTGQVLIARGFREIATLGASWVRLGRTPVRAIGEVAEISASGARTILAAGAYAIDIDGNGDGWVRLGGSGLTRIEVTYQAGIAAEWANIPAALRHGVTRLAAHLYTFRTGPDGGPAAAPPAAVAALWRPYRRFRLG